MSRVRLTSAQKKAVSQAVDKQVLTGGCPNLNVVDRLSKTGVKIQYEGQPFRVSVGYEGKGHSIFYPNATRRAQEVHHLKLLVVDGEVYAAEDYGWSYQGRGANPKPEHLRGRGPQEVREQAWDKFVATCAAMQELVDKMLGDSKPSREESELQAHKRDLKRARDLQRKIKACFWVGGFEMDTPVDIDTVWATLTDARNIMQDVIEEEQEIIKRLEQETAVKVRPV